MVYIMNKENNNSTQGITSIELEQFIQKLSITNYHNMNLEEVKTYFESNYNNDNNNDDNDDNKKERYGFITEDLNSNKQYDCNFEQLSSFELNDILTISTTASKNNIAIYIYKSEVTCLRADIKLI